MPTATEEKGVAERSMGFGLRWLSRLAGSDLLDRIRIRKQVERALFSGTKNGFRTATAAGRTFGAAQKLTGPARQATGKPRSLFDLTPDEEQQMLQEGVRDFAAAEVRPVAAKADAERKAPSELLAQVNELGVNMLGVPEELGGVMHEQAAVTSVLIGEALAHGDMGIAYAALAPGAVATAIAHWGTPEQEATYLPSFTARTRRRRRWRCSSLTRSSIRSSWRRRHAATAPTGSSKASSPWSRVPPSASSSSSPPRPRASGRRSS